MTDLVEVRAGKQAFQHIQEQGLQPDHIQLMLGASGGPKWFVLQGLDNFLFGDYFKRRTTALNLLGTSAGAWRFASLGQTDPAAASRLFSKLYRATVYSDKPDVAEITDKAIELLKEYVPPTAVAQILQQTEFRHHMIVARSRGIGAFENRAVQGLSLIAAASANMLRRKFLGHHFERMVFYHPASKPLGKSWNDLPTRHIKLTQANFHYALLATGSIPMVLAGVKNIPGAPPGTYRDGGVTDYHFDLDLSEQQGLILYPHFQREIIPGWFDKKLPRRSTGKLWPNMINIVPTQEFIDRLPYGKIPDRHDFANLAPEPRQKYWQQATDAGYEMAEQFANWLEKGELAKRVKLWD
ncbi:alpha/beta hydrolase [Aliidiomarina quisquiliarum]|uniref:alpha/beta hydrolase n=1 Tax=Aliidiomarina quisquiliarum TaxID=2938947 RepID=UPI00208FCC8F|nr:alpha/beta hydrolase [Aliidiomarina quisquiliarum]MCO4320496.1 alpha/beta hydrolase [Aliidiomarina quisquiliarum]